MNHMRRAAVAVAVSAFVLSACQTTGTDQPPGAVVGGVTGAAVGLGAESGIRIASGGHAGNPLLGLLVGAVVGGLAGHFMSSSDDSGTFGEAERKLADDAAMQILTDPTLKIVHWESETHSRVYGWAEPSIDGAIEVKKGCRAIRTVRFVNGLGMNENKQYCRNGEEWVKAEGS